MENRQAHRRETFLTEVTGKKNIYIKVSLKIVVPWILLTPKILYKHISKFARKYLQ